MQIGSKLAILKLEEVSDNYYKADLIEYIYNIKIPYKNKWELQQYYNIMIQTDLPLEVAKFDKKIEPKVCKKQNGDTYTIEENKYSFERISNPENSIIRILDFKFEKNNAYTKKGKPIMRNDMNRQRVNEIFTITNCEFDCIGWKLPDKQLESKIKYMEKKHKEWKEKLLQNKKEKTDLKTKLKTRDYTIIKLREQIKELKKHKEVSINNTYDIQSTKQDNSKIQKTKKKKKTIDYSISGFEE